MSRTAAPKTVASKRYRPKMATVFLAAFAAGGTAAVGVNRLIDVARTQSQQTVECEPILIALRPLQAGSPVTIWDVALRDWPKAMVPSAAMRPDDAGRWCNDDTTFVAKVALREGQPILRAHLVAAAPAAAVVVEAGSEAPPETNLETATVEAPITIAAVAPDTEASPATSTTAAGDVIRGDAITVVPSEAVPTPADAAAPAVETVAEVSTETVATIEPSTGEGWPTAAEWTKEGESAMRFLVVPERIAILADELTAPAKPSAQPSPRPVEAAPVARSATKPRTNAGPPQGGAASPPRVAQPPRTMPPSPAIRQRNPMPQPTSPAANGSRRPAQSARTGTPPVRVKPEPESDEAVADQPFLRSVFPNMAAGLEKFEAEMSRIRRERFGSLFQESGNEPDRDVR